MAKQSAGILMFKRDPELQLFLVHPGGPFYKNKDEGFWSIPKGEFLEGEEALTAARREFEEETGSAVDGNFIQLSTIEQKGKKTIYAWAVEGDIDADRITSNEFEMVWPPKSGIIRSFPENDRASWFSLNAAREKIIARQAVLLDDLLTHIGEGS